MPNSIPLYASLGVQVSILFLFVQLYRSIQRSEEPIMRFLVVSVTKSPPAVNGIGDSGML